MRRGATLLLLLLLSLEGRGIADPVVPGGLAYGRYAWPTPPSAGGEAGFTRFDVLLTVARSPGAESRYFWAYQFLFLGGDGGYMGLQSSGTMRGAWVGRMAIFSIWQALSARPGPGAACERFTGEGEGWSCRAPFPFLAGRGYRLRLQHAPGLGAPQHQEWWRATVRDQVTGAEAVLGDIQVPARWQHLKTSQVWVEYFGQAGSCGAAPYARARFTAPSADGGRFAPEQLARVYGKTCDNARARLLPELGIDFETGAAVRR